MSQQPTARRGAIDRFLTIVEKAGNALPHPATLFAIFALLAVLASWLFSKLGVVAVHPKDDSTVEIINLVSANGLHWILEHTITNFTGFAPLGTVMVAMLGIGVAEKSGLIGTVLRLMVNNAPRRLLTFVLVFTGVLSNMASDVGYVLLVPLGAVVFASVGRHPLAGLAAAFAGVSGGFSANLLLGTIDPLLAGITQEAARIIEPGHTVTPACNYWFMMVSTFIVAGVGTWVTEAIVEPRLGTWEGDGETDQTSDGMAPLTGAEKRGLAWALVFNVVLIGLVLWGLLPADGVLRDPVSGDILHSPFIHGIVTFIFLGGFLSGIAYGFGAGTFKGERDVVEGMREALVSLSLFMVLVFFAAQFVAAFKYTHLGMVLAIKGADLLQASNLGPIPLMIGFLLLSAALNMLMGSASAKWAFMAPVFVPMFMLLGFSPELVQGVYRIGDSSTNLVSPMMSFFALIVAYVQRYRPSAGIGTVIATMLPYSMAFLLVWTLLLVIWMLLGLPLVPGGGLDKDV